MGAVERWFPVTVEFEACDTETALFVKSDVAEELGMVPCTTV